MPPSTSKGATRKRTAIWQPSPDNRLGQFVSVLRIRLKRILFLFAAAVLCIWAIRTVPTWPHTATVIRKIFYLFPAITGYFFAMAGLAVAFLGEELKRLERYRVPRVLVALVVVLIGVGAVISDSVQKTEQLSTASSERDRLMGRIDTLVAQVDTMTQQTLPQLLGRVSERPVLSTEKSKVRPDLSLSITGSRALAVRIVNAVGAGVASQPKYSVFLADLDNMTANILPIPTFVGDFIRPGEGNNLLDAQVVKRDYSTRQNSLALTLA